jgi:hypothetical protein
MMLIQERSLPRAVALVLLALAACTEPRVSPRAAVPTPALEATLELSDTLPAAGSRIVVGVHLRGENAARVASFTGRVRYDTTGLRFVDEVALADGATRVSNPAAGALRVAALDPKGFASGTIAEYHFEVIRPSAIPAMRLEIEELHQLDRTDASHAVQLLRGPTARLP